MMDGQTFGNILRKGTKGKELKKSMEAYELKKILSELKTGDRTWEDEPKVMIVKAMMEHYRFNRRRVEGSINL